MKMTGSRNLLLGVLLACLNALPAAGQQKAVKPQLILQRMIKVYASCSSYQDTGVVETIYSEVSARPVNLIPFKTYFSRPDLFRFEFQNTNRATGDALSTVLWCARNGCHYYEEGEGVEDKSSPGLAIASATGVSGGAAYTVPTILFQDRIGFQLMELTDLVLKGEERFEGTACYVLTGNHPFGPRYEIWIGKQDYLMRKLTTRSTSSGLALIENEIHRDIKINLTIPPRTFQFKPPEKTPHIGMKGQVKTKVICQDADDGECLINTAATSAVGNPGRMGF